MANKNESFADVVKRRKKEERIANSQREFNDLQSYIKSGSDVINKVYGGWNSASDMDSYKSTLDEANKRVADFNRRYGDLYGGLSDVTNNFSSALSSWDDTKNMYSYYKTKDAFDAALNEKKDSRTRLQKYNDEAAEYAGLENSNFEDIVENTKQMYKQYGKAGARKWSTDKLDEADYDNQQTGYYILGKYGRDSEQYKDFLTALQYDNDMKAYEEIEQKGRALADSNWGVKAVGALNPFAQTLLQPAMAAQKLIQGADYNPYKGPAMVSQFGNALSNEVSNNIYEATGSKTAAFLYDSLESGVQSYLGALTFGEAFTPFMGMGAYNEAYASALERGLDKSHAEATALASGIAEALFEYVSIEHFMDLKSPASIKGILKNIAGQSLAEGSEELSTEGANTITDWIINGDKREYNQNKLEYIKRGYTEEEASKMAFEDWMGQMVLSFAGGALTGGVMGGISSVGQYNSNKQLGADIDKASYSTMMNELGNVNPNAEAFTEYQKLVEQYGEDFSGANTKKDFAKIGANITNATTYAAEQSNEKTNGQDYMGRYREIATAGNVIANGGTIEKADNAKTTEEKPFENEAITKIYNENLTGDREAYDKNFRLLNLYAQNGKTFEEALADIDTNVISESKASQIYNSILAETKMADAVQTKAVNDTEVKWSQTNKAGSFTSGTMVKNAEGKMVFQASKDYNEFYNSLSKQEKKLAKFFNMFSKLGMDIRVIADDSATSKNGFVTSNDNVVTINLRARYEATKRSGDERREYVMQTFAHESTHWVENILGDEFETFKTVVKETMGLEWDRAVQRQLGKGKSMKVAESEAVARFCEGMIDDASVIDRLVQTAGEARINRIINAIKKWFKEIRADIQELVSKVPPSSQEAQYARELDAEFKILQDMWVDMFQKALIKNQTLSEEAKEIQSESKLNVVNDNTVMLSEKTYENGGREFMANFLDSQIAKGQLTEEDKIQIMDQLDWAQSLSKSFSMNPNFVDYAEWQKTDAIKDSFGQWITAIVSNGDYDYNIDFATVCKKRKALDRVLNELVKSGMFDDYMPSGECLTEIINNIKANGFEVACALCFVDAKRYRVGSWANNYLEGFTDDNKKYNIGYNEMVRQMAKLEGVSTKKFDFLKRDLLNLKNKGKTLDQLTLTDDSPSIKYLKDIIKNNKVGTNNHTKATALLEKPELRKILNPNEIISSAGLDALRAQQTDLFDLVKASSGSATPKLSLTEVAYANEVAKDFHKKKPKDQDKMRDDLRKVGGYRVQSFSDYMGNMVLDYVQLISNFAGCRFASHAYTKEYAFVKLFGMTGMKINMSIVPDSVSAELKEKFAEITKDESKLGQKRFDAVRDEYLYYKEHAGMTKCSESEADYYDESDGSYWKYITVDESFPLDKAFEIQKDSRYNKNCGIIWVGVSKHHILSLLRNDNVPMVIPYHKSNINPTIAHLRGIAMYNDYTNVQSEKMWVSDGKGGQKLVNLSNTSKNKMNKELYKKLHSEFNFYDALAEAEKEWTPKSKRSIPQMAADKYLAFCKKNGIVPKFSEFAEEDGYYKLLEDFRLYDGEGNYAPQTAVTMTFPEDFSYQVEQSLKETAKTSTDMRAKQDKLIQENKAIVEKYKNAEQMNSDKVDEEYLELAKDEVKNYEVLDKMVHDAAIKNGYRFQMFHETNAENIHVFDVNIGTHGSTDSETPYGIFTKSSSKNIGLGNRQMALYVKSNKRLTVSNREDVKNKILSLVPYYDRIAEIDKKYSELNDKLMWDELTAMDEWQEEHPDADMDEIYPTSYIVEDKPADIDSQKYLDAFNKRKQSMEEWTEKFNEVAIQCKNIITNYLRDNGYDSMYFVVDGGSRGRETDSLIVLDSNQVKSADPVTYDDNGNVIPLSERFNSEDDDIRYDEKIDGGVGVNINCKEYNFVQQILAHKKTIETRDTPSLRPYIGKRIGIVETGKGKAMLRGYATVSKEIHYTNQIQFTADYNKHLVEPGSSYDYNNSKHGTKYGYVLTNVVRCKPTEISSKGIISRKVPDEKNGIVKGWPFSNIREISENDAKVQSYKAMRHEKIFLTQAEYADAAKQIAEDISDAMNMDESLDFRGFCFTNNHLVFYESFDDVNPQIVDSIPLAEVVKHAGRSIWIRDNIDKLINAKGSTRAENRKAVTQFAREVGSRGFDRILHVEYGKGRQSFRPVSYFSEKVGTDEATLLRDNERLTKQNETLKADMAKLRKKLSLEKKVTKGKVLNDKYINDVAKWLVKKADSNYSVDEVAKELTRIYNRILDEGNDWDTVMGEAYELGNSILAEAKPHEFENAWKRTILDDFRMTKINLTEEQKNALREEYGSHWYQSISGKLKFVKEGGMSTSEAIEYWQNSYGIMRDASDNEVDQIFEILDMEASVSQTKEMLEHHIEYQERAALAGEIYNKLWYVPTVTTTADKYDAEIKKLKAEHKKAMAELKENLTVDTRKLVDDQKLADDIHYGKQLSKADKKYNDLAKRYKQSKDDIEKQRLADQIYYSRIINDVRERQKKTMAEYKQYQKDKALNQKDLAERRRLVNKISDSSKEMAKWINHPDVKNGKLVPDALKKPVSDLLSAIDFSSKRALGMTWGENSGVPTKKDVSFASAMRQMYETVRDIENKKTDDFGLDLPPQFADDWDALSERVRKISEKANGDDGYILNQMTTEELQSLDLMVTAMFKAVKEANRIIIGKNKVHVASIAQDTIKLEERYGAKDVSKYRAVDRIGQFFKFDNLLPVYAFKNMGEGAKKVFDEIRNGWCKYAFNIKEIENYVKTGNDGKPIYTGDDVKKWENTTHEFEVLMRDKKGNATGETRKVTLTEAQMMSLYCLSKREQAKSHLFHKGFVVSDINSKDQKKAVIQSDNIPLTVTELEKILAEVESDAKMKMVADKLQEFMNTRCSEWGNEITMARFGITAFGEKNYFPIKVAPTELDADVKDNTKSLYGLLNMSFTKPLVQKASNAILLESIFDVFENHTEEMAKYNSLALPLLNTLKWWNYSEENADETKKSVRGTLKTVYGAQMNSYIYNFLTDINGQQERGRGEDLPKAMLKNYKIAAIGGNLQVALLQPLSYVRAAFTVNWKYLASSYNPKDIKHGIEMKNKYSGLAVWKDMGFFDVNIGRGLDKLIRQDKTVMDKVTDLSLVGAEKMDDITWGALWTACEKQTKAEKNLSGEALMEATAELFNETVMRTQVFDSTISRSSNMRSNSFEAQVLTAFMSEPTLGYNTLLDVCSQYALDARKMGRGGAFKKHGKTFAKAAYLYAVSAALESVVRTAWSKIKTPDDDDEDIEEVWKKFFSTFLQNANPLNNLPIIKDLFDIADGYSPKRMEYEAFSTFQKAYKYYEKMIDEGVVSYKAVYTILQALSQVAGYPVSGTLKSVIDIWNAIVGRMYDDLIVK